MATPRIPPTEESKTVSTRNWAVISHCLAPSARRTPISLVRSVTLASMIFIMPMPPTNNEMPAMDPSTRFQIRFSSSARCINSIGMTRRKSSLLGWVSSSNLRAMPAVWLTKFGSETSRVISFNWVRSKFRLPVLRITWTSPNLRCAQANGI